MKKELSLLITCGLLLGSLPRVQAQTQVVKSVDFRSMTGLNWSWFTNSSAEIQGFMHSTDVNQYIVKFTGKAGFGYHTQSKAGAKRFNMTVSDINLTTVGPITFQPHPQKLDYIRVDGTVTVKEEGSSEKQIPVSEGTTFLGFRNEDSTQLYVAFRHPDKTHITFQMIFDVTWHKFHPWDLNRDGSLNRDDMSFFIANFGRKGGYSFKDFLNLSRQWPEGLPLL